MEDPDKNLPFKIPLSLLRGYFLWGELDIELWYTFDMKLLGIYSGTEEALLNKKYDIGVGISLGNKYFTPEKVLESIKWALQYTKNHLVVYVADSIHAINLEVRGNKSPESAMRSALRKGEVILGEVKELVEKELSENQIPIYYTSWVHIENSPEYIQKKEFLHNLYNQRGDFYKIVTGLVKEMTDGEERAFSDEQIDKLGTYFIEELPEVLDRVPLAGHSCDAYIYPETSSFTEFIVQIQNGEIFPEIKKSVIDVPKIFIHAK